MKKKRSAPDSEKLLCVYEAPAGAFISGRWRFLEFRDMRILKKLQICQHLVKQSSKFVLNSRIWDRPIPSDADDDGGDAPTIFPSGQTPIPFRAGIKYPVRESLTSIMDVRQLSMWQFEALEFR